MKRLSALAMAILCGAALWVAVCFANRYTVAVPPANSEPSTTTASKPTTTQPPLPDNPIDFADLQARYPEAVGWIRVPGTVIDYPIMQSGPDTPEDFYLTHNEEGKKIKHGSIYIQRYNTPGFTDPNTILYGHNMANGSMFAAIHKFRKDAFFEENQYIYVYTPGHVLTYRIYSLFINEERHLMVTYDFDTEEGFGAYLEKTMDPPSSVQQTRKEVIPTTADRVITLCTCTNKRDGDGRLLLVAVLEEDQRTK